MRLSHAIAVIVLSIAALVSSEGRAAPTTTVAGGAQLPQRQGVISGSGPGGIGDVTSGSATIANINTSGWSVGMGVTIMRAGTLSTLNAPVIGAATASNPGAGHSCVYECAAEDLAGGLSPASAPSAAITCGAARSPAAAIEFPITPVAGAQGYLCWVQVDGAPFTFVGMEPATASAPTDASTYFIDMGQALADDNAPQLPPAAATADNLYGVVTALAPFTVSGPAQENIAGTRVLHNDARLINLAIASAQATNYAYIDLPIGTYQINEPIVCGSPGAACNNLHLEGHGQLSTILQTGSALGGLPVVKIENGSFGYIHDLWIEGNSASEPMAGIQSDVNNPSGVIGGVGRLVVDRVTLFGLSGDSLNDGIIQTAAVGYDENNEQFYLGTVAIGNTSRAGWYIGHLNALLNHAVGASIQGGHYALLLRGGSATLEGTMLGTSSHTANDYLVNVDRGDYTHDPIEASGVVAENGSCFLRTDAKANAWNNGYIHFAASDIGAGVPGGNCIDFESASLGFSMVNVSGLGIGTGVTATFNTPYPIKIEGGSLGITAINCAGQIELDDVNWPAGGPPNISGTGCALFGSSVTHNGSVGWQPPRYTVANAPRCDQPGSPKVGAEIEITDNVAACAAGAPIAGGGSNACYAICNGASYQVIGVVAPSIDQLASAAGDYSMNGHGLTGLTNGKTGADAVAFGQMPLAATSGAIGGGMLRRFACTTPTMVAVPTATTAMAVIVSPAGGVNPGAAFEWNAQVIANDTVSVQVCNRTNMPATPVAAAYNIRVVQ